MKRLGILVLAGLLSLVGWSPRIWAEDKPVTPTPATEAPGFTRTQDVIYGRKFGTALTMDVFTPKTNANGAAIIWVISGGWFSSHDNINAGPAREYLRRGYTVFAVVHGSQPKFTIPEAIADMKRSVRFIRYNAKRFHIDPDRIGVTGGSAGGHLSLILGTSGDDGNPKAKDPVDRTSSRVEAVACFFPPTDFLNYGEKGHIALGRGKLDWLRPPFDFQEWDAKKKRFERVTDEKKLEQIGRAISPIYHISKDSAPTLIIHGDADRLVPLQQSESFIARLKEAGVPAKLIVKHGADHGWAHMDKDQVIMADWFDKYLLKK